MSDQDDWARGDEVPDIVKNILSHEIVTGTHDNHDYLYEESNVCRIVGVKLSLSFKCKDGSGAEEHWELEWDHPNQEKRFGFIVIKVKK